jgi:surface protein
MLTLLGVGQGQDAPNENDINELVEQFKDKVIDSGGTFVSQTCLENNLPDFDLVLATTLINMPVVTGVLNTTTFEYTISTTTGKYNGTQPITFAYQWYKNGVLLGGFTSQSFVTTSIDYGSYSCQITATNQFGVIVSFSNSFTIENAFRFQINTFETAGGSSNNKQFKLPLTNNGIVNISVNWGDGQVDSITSWDDPKKLHTYSTGGIYTIKIFGTLQGWRFNFNLNEDIYKLKEIYSWGTNVFYINTDATFYGCDRLIAPNLDTRSAPVIQSTSLANCFRLCSNFNGNISSWDVSNVTNMQRMLGGARLFNKPMSSWNVSNVTNMAGMFSGAELFNQDIGGWDVSNVTDMSYMFNNATSFNQPIGIWKVSNVGYMSYMFANATSFNGEIASWDTLSVTDMTAMFNGAIVFNNGISNWDVSNVTNMSIMFAGATSFNRNINDWDVSKVTDMIGMFSGAISFNEPLDLWDVSSVTSMVNMFENATAFNQDISSWGVSNVTDMSYMFNNATSFNQPIGIWKVSNVGYMSYMFANATAFNTQLDKWNISNVIDFAGFMEGKSSFDYDTTYLADIYTEWSLLPVQPNLNIDFGTIQYTIDGQDGKDVLEADPNFWVINDGGVFV